MANFGGIRRGVCLALLFFFVEKFGFEMTIRNVGGTPGSPRKKMVGVFGILDHELRPSLSRPIFLLGICFDKRFFWGMATLAMTRSGPSISRGVGRKSF